MKLHPSLKTGLIFFLILFNLTLKINAQNPDQFDDYPTVKSNLNKKIWVTSKFYYLITKATDSTVNLYWGNKYFRRKYNTSLDVSSAEKLDARWSNNNYLVLEYGTGSSVWVNIVLPIDKNEKPIEFCNGIYFDKKYNLFVSEGYGDTILIVHNSKTKKEQFIIDKRHCCAANNDVCVGLVEIKDKVLYTTWNPDNCTGDNKKVYKRKVKLKI